MKFFMVEGKKHLLKKIKEKKGTYKFELVPYTKEVKDTLEFVANKVKSSVDRKQLVLQALSNLEYNEVLKIKDALKKGQKAKGRRGCFEIQVGKQYIPIVS